MRRLLNSFGEGYAYGGSPFQGWCPASEANDGGCPGKPDHLTQALCWLLDELLDAEDDLMALAARPEALSGWRRERLGEFCQRMGAALLAE